MLELNGFLFYAKFHGTIHSISGHWLIKNKY